MTIRDNRQADADDDGQRMPDADEAPRVARMVEPERLERARDAVPHVQADEQRADDIEHHPQRAAEDFDLRAVEIADRVAADAR